MRLRNSQTARIYRRLRSRGAPAVKAMMLRTGAFHVLRTMAPSRKVAILRYHAICGAEGHGYASPAICISPSAFEAHVRYLTANYRVLALPDVVTALWSGQSLPPNAVVLTFDDGYADNFEAARTLHRYGATGTFYLTAGCLDGGQPFWPAEIRHLLSVIPRSELVLTSDDDPVAISLATDQARQAAIDRLTRLFKSRSISVRERLRDELRRAAGNPRLPRFMLTWEQVREMHGMGMTVGAHTMTHPNLPSAGLTDAAVEIQGSRERLEQEIGAPVTMFSYPNGGAERYYTRELQRLVASAGFASATTSRNGFATATSDPYALERVQVRERLQDLVFALEVERLAPTSK
jgi:peptidoglycan/xylan/chitin deacetylase (PgdA/CDA1 family)